MDQNNSGGNINFPAIHAAYNEYKGKVGNGAQAPHVPQPEGNHPMHSMMVEAMSRATQKPGEDHGSMIIRALSDHLKRTSPDVSSIHKNPQKTGGY